MLKSYNVLGSTVLATSLTEAFRIAGYNAPRDPYEPPATQRSPRALGMGLDVKGSR